jgi:hypothetical protein
VIKFCWVFTVARGSIFWLTSWKGHFQCLAGRETYIKSTATSVCSCCFSEQRTFLVCSRTTWKSCSRDSKFWNRTGMLRTGNDVLLLQNVKVHRSHYQINIFLLYLHQCDFPVYFLCRIRPIVHFTSRQRLAALGCAAAEFISTLINHAHCSWKTCIMVRALLWSKMKGLRFVRG